MILASTDLTFESARSDEDIYSLLARENAGDFEIDAGACDLLEKWQDSKTSKWFYSYHITGTCSKDFDAPFVDLGTIFDIDSLQDDLADLIS